MNMKKFFAAMAATAVSASAFAAMTLTSANAADVVAVAGLYGQMSDLNGQTVTQWNADDAATNGSTVANIDGNAQYEATWKITGDEVTVADFLIVELNGPNGTDFSADIYPDLAITVDEVYVDGVEQTMTANDAAYNLKYYEGNGRARAYLADNWNVNGGNTLGYAATSAKSEIKVVFTVAGLYNDGTSNVTETEAPTTEAPTTTAATTTAAGATTTTGAATTTKAGATTTKAANGGKTETSTNTGVAGVGVAASALALAGVAAFVARKKD